MEETFNYVYYQVKPLHIFKREKFVLTTYSSNADPAHVPTKAKIHVTNANDWFTQTGTEFNLMGADPVYDDAMAPDIAGEETKARTSSWYAIVAIRSNFVFDNFEVTNELKLKDDDYAFINPINLGAKTLEIHRSDFTMYGTVMVAFTTLQFDSTYVTIDTENLVGGFVFVISCDPTIDVVIGEVVIDNLRLDGARVELFKYGGIYMTGPQNFTIQNSYIGSYGFMFDAKQLTRADSPLNCKPTDNVPQNIIMKDTVYNMSAEFQGTPHHGFIVSFLEWYPRQDMKIKFNNNRIMNIQRTFYRALLLDVYWADIECNDNEWINTTSAVDVTLLKTTKTITINSNTFTKVSSTSQNIFVMQDASEVRITNWHMNGADDDVVSSAVINLNLAQNAEAYLNDIRFTGNVF